MRQKSKTRTALMALALTGVFTSRAAAADKPAALEVALGDVSINKVPFLIAADAGLYAKNGLDVQQFITPFAAEGIKRSGVIVPANLVRADLDGAAIEITGGTPMIYWLTTDARAVHRIILATTETTIKDHIITTDAVAKVEDLKGKRLGYSVPGAVTHLGALVFLKKMGWDPNRDISLMGNGNGLNPLKEGREDALLGSPTVIALAPNMKLKDLVDLGKYKIPVAGSSILAEQHWLKQNHDEAARFVKAIVEAIALMKTDKAVMSAALVKWFNVEDRATQDRMFASAQDLPSKPYPAVEGIKNTMAIYDSPEMRKYRPEDFYDSSFIEALDKSGAIDRLYRK